MANLTALRRQLESRRAAQQEGDVIQLDSGSVFPSVPSIRLQGTRFAVIDDPKEPKKKKVLKLSAITGVIVGANAGRFKMYYKKKFNPNEVTQPDCFSFGGLVPHPSVASPQSDACMDCAMNKKQSRMDDSGNTITAKPCTDNRMIAFYLTGYAAKQGLANKVFALKVTPAALASFGECLQQLGNNITSQEIEISFDTTVSYPKMVFTPTGVSKKVKIAEGSATAELINNITFKTQIEEEEAAVESMLGGTAAESTPPFDPDIEESEDEKEEIVIDSDDGDDSDDDNVDVEELQDELDSI